MQTKITDIPFQVHNIETLVPEEHSGLTGKAYWKTVKQGNVRMRIVEYTPGYLADHWCDKGHAVFVLDGELESELKDGYFLPENDWASSKSLTGMTKNILVMSAT